MINYKIYFIFHWLGKKVQRDKKINFYINKRPNTHCHQQAFHNPHIFFFYLFFYQACPILLMPPNTCSSPWLLPSRKIFHLSATAFKSIDYFQLRNKLYYFSSPPTLFPYCAFWKEVSMCSLHLRSEGVSLDPRRNKPY